MSHQELQVVFKERYDRDKLLYNNLQLELIEEQKKGNGKRVDEIKIQLSNLEKQMNENQQKFTQQKELAKLEKQTSGTRTQKRSVAVEEDRSKLLLDKLSRLKKMNTLSPNTSKKVSDRLRNKIKATVGNNPEKDKVEMIYVKDIHLQEGTIPLLIPSLSMFAKRFGINRDLLKKPIHMQQSFKVLEFRDNSWFLDIDTDLGTENLIYTAEIFHCTTNIIKIGSVTGHFDGIVLKNTRVEGGKETTTIPTLLNKPTELNKEGMDTSGEKVINEKEEVEKNGKEEVEKKEERIVKKLKANDTKGKGPDFNMIFTVYVKRANGMLGTSLSYFIDYSQAHKYVIPYSGTMVDELFQEMQKVVTHTDKFGHNIFSKRRDLDLKMGDKVLMDIGVCPSDPSKKNGRLKAIVTGKVNVNINYVKAKKAFKKRRYKK